MILGTAGHIDHGKTTLVRALTGVDTDRLPEEKQRGITIELGFAPLRLDDGRTIGIVDVPGHDAFVRTMLAGATGMDLAMLVIAADEGVMPQTREHLAILSLLGVGGGVIALAKSDLVDADWLELVREDVRTLTTGSPLADAPIIPVSATTGAGLDALRTAIAAAADAIPARDADDIFRLPIDRAFTVKGTGTVITGTVWSGSLERDATVRVQPSGATARVRGLQAHGVAVDRVAAGMRAAIALAGVDVGEVARGGLLVTDAAWQPTRVLLADVALLDDATLAPGPRTRVRFHLGTSDAGARIVARGGLRAGAASSARVVLDEPIVARAGDRFVLRSASPAATIGGGIVRDPHPPHQRPRPWLTSAVTPAERLALLLSDAGTEGVATSTLPVRLGVRPTEIPELVATTDEVNGRLYRYGILTELCRTLAMILAAHHAAAPLEPGLSLQEARSRLRVSTELADEVLRRAVAEETVELLRGVIREHGWRPAPTAAQQMVLDALYSRLKAAVLEPPSVGELVAAYGPDVPALLRLLEGSGLVVQVEGDRYYEAEAVTRMLDRLRAGMVPGREYGPAELREILGVSRKYLIPLLEHCDRIQVTDRKSGGRILRGT